MLILILRLPPSHPKQARTVHALADVNLLGCLLSVVEYLAAFKNERDKSRKLKYLKSTNGSDAQSFG